MARVSFLFKQHFVGQFPVEFPFGVRSKTEAQGNRRIRERQLCGLHAEAGGRRAGASVGLNGCVSQ